MRLLRGSNNCLLLTWFTLLPLGSHCSLWVHRLPFALPLLQTLGEMASQAASTATQPAAVPQTSQPGGPSHDGGAIAAASIAQGEKKLEDRVRETEALIAQRRKQKLQEEHERAKAKESQRRSEGKDMVEVKRARKKQADQLWIQERMKQKEEERLARAEVLAKLEQDKEERRRARQNVTPHQGTAGGAESSVVRQRVASSPSSSSSFNPTSNTRLQFRLPHGGPVVEQFGSSSTLGDAREFIVEVSVSTASMPVAILSSNCPLLLFSFPHNAPPQNIPTAPAVPALPDHA